MRKTRGCTRAKADPETWATTLEEVPHLGARLQHLVPTEHQRQERGLPLRPTDGQDKPASG